MAYDTRDKRQFRPDPLVHRSAPFLEMFPVHGVFADDPGDTGGVEIAATSVGHQMVRVSDDLGSVEAQFMENLPARAPGVAGVPVRVEAPHQKILGMLQEDGRETRR